VTSLDSSAKMLELARQRLGDSADLHHADLNSPLPFPDGAFDDAIAALVLHVDHPILFPLLNPDGDYFATTTRSEEWDFGGQTAAMSFWHRPLHAMTDAFTAAGFRISVISEPHPAPGARELFPDIFADKPSGAFLCFLFFVLQAG
jgi:SAM-dependent methyltransferase